MDNNASEAKKEIRTGTLREDLELIPPGEHGNEWMLFDPVSGHYYKMTPQACRIIKLLDRNYELDEFLTRLEKAGIKTCREEVLELLQFFHGNCLTVPEYGSVAKKIAMHREAKRKSRLHRLAAAYLFFKLPPIHPDRFFTRTAPFVTQLFNRWVVFAILITALIGYLMLIQNWNKVYTTFLDTLSWAGLVKYFWAILAAKILHEFSHGYVAKAYGCRIRGIGISFIVFYPRLFTDLTDSWRLARSKRMAIDGAGIAAELLFGGLAGLVWLHAPPGDLRSTMFYLFAVSTFGTLLVNGNPFIRYDGYYLLCDLLNIDNLMQRSSDYIRDWNRYILFGIGPRPSAKGASPGMLYVFGVSAFIYRLFLYTSIILIVYFQFAKPLAIVLVIVECLAMLLLPLYRECRMVAHLRPKMERRHVIVSGCVAVSLLLLLVIPLPWSYSLPCEIQPEEKKIIAVKESGFASEKLKKEPFEVTEGSRILSMNNPFLELNIRRCAAMVDENRAELDLMRSDAKTIHQTRSVYEKLQSNSLTLQEMRRRLANLELIGTSPGIFVPRIKDVSAGRWLEKGIILGEVISPANQIFAYATDREVNRISKGDSVYVVLHDELETITGKVTAVNPVPVKFRDSPLIQLFGGPLPCYFNQKAGEFKPVQVLYCITVTPEKPLIANHGRTGTAGIRKNYILGELIFRNLLHGFLRELTF